MTRWMQDWLVVVLAVALTGIGAALLTTALGFAFTRGEAASMLAYGDKAKTPQDESTESERYAKDLDRAGVVSVVLFLAVELIAACIFAGARVLSGLGVRRSIRGLGGLAIAFLCSGSVALATLSGRLPVPLADLDQFISRLLMHVVS